jgi:hypothetical protein
MLHDLNDGNFLIYAAKNYDRPHILQSEFDDDLLRIKYVKRLMRKYRHTGELKERLVLNHIIIISNVFGVEATVNMLFFKVDKEDYQVLKTFLIYLNYMPNKIKMTINGSLIRQEEIPVDLAIAQKLREI